MELRIKKNLKDYRIKHWDIIKDESMEGMVSTVARATNKSIQEIYRIDKNSLVSAFVHICKVFGSHEKKDPPKEIEINGKQYSLVNISKQPVGWFIDVSTSDYEKNPVKMAAHCYIEKGTKYAEQDEHGNILNPVSDRVKIFEEHFPLDVFIDLNGFFLRKWAKYRKAKAVIDRERLKMIKRKSQRSTTG